LLPYFLSFLASLLRFILTFSPFFKEKSIFSLNYALSMLGSSYLYKLSAIHFITIRFILEDNTKIKGIIPIPESHTDPNISTFRILQSNSIATRTIVSLYNGFLIIGRDFSLAEYILIFINKDDLDDSIFLCDFDAALPDHVFPII